MRRRRYHRVDLTVAEVGELLALAAIANPDPDDPDLTPDTLAVWHKARAAVAANRPTLVSVWH